MGCWWLAAIVLLSATVNTSHMLEDSTDREEVLSETAGQVVPDIHQLEEQESDYGDDPSIEDYPDAFEEQLEGPEDGESVQRQQDNSNESPDELERELEALTEQIEGEDNILAAQEESLVQENSFQEDDEGGDDLVDLEQDEGEEDPDEEEMEAILQQEDGMGPDTEEEMAISEQDGSDDEGGTALAQWNNQYDGPLHVVCPPGEGLYSMKSIHSNKKEDRLYSWYCKKVYSAVAKKSDSESVMQILRLHKGTIRKIRRHFRRTRKRYHRRHKKLRQHLRRLRHHGRRQRLRINTIKRKLYSYQLRYYRCNLRYMRLLNRYRRLLSQYRVEKTRNRYTQHKGCLWKKANTWDQKMNYQCPTNSYLAGVSSQHDNSKEDREWYTYCCGTQGLCTKSCSWSGFLNQWDGPINYGTKGVITGLYSIHDNKKQDRRWKIRSCSVAKC